MAVKSSGAISIQDIVNEFGGNAPHALNEYYRGGRVPNVSENSNVPTEGAISLDDFYGAVNIFELTISTNTADLDAIEAAKEAGWNETSILRVVVNSGIYVYGDEAGKPGITVKNHPMRVMIENYGFIMGRGGDGGRNGSAGAAGAAGILFETSSTNPQPKITNHPDAYIAGGGGGGGGGIQAGGGGGAGGGRGGRGSDSTSSAYTAGGAPGERGSNSATGGNNTTGQGGSAGGSGGGVQENKGSDSISAGGGGGRILPGTGVNALLPYGNKDDWAGGYGGGPEQVGGNNNRTKFNDPTATEGNISTHGGAGGGGWGAAGGTSNKGGGAAGRGITWGNNKPEIINNGTIYGAYT